MTVAETGQQSAEEVVVEQPVEGAATPEAQPQEEAPQETSPDEAGAQGEAGKKNLSPVEKRFNQLTWQKHEAERRANAAALEQEKSDRLAYDLWQENQELKRRTTMPRLEQFNYDPAAYEAAIRQHNERFVAESRQADQVRAQQAAENQSRAQAQSRLSTRISEASTKYPDYVEVVGNPALPPLQTVNPLLMQALVEHENMAELSYFLGKNPAEAHRLAAMPPARAVLELGSLAARLPENMPRQQSKAPPPAAQVSGKSATAQKTPADMNYDEYVSWRRKNRR